MQYEYKCSQGHVSEASHPMAAFDEGYDGPDPRVNLCECGETAKKVILSTPFFSIDQLSDWTAPSRGRTGGMNLGANQTFKNRAARKEWMKASGTREMYPEEAARETSHLQDVKQARWDGVAPPEHPDIAERRKGVVTAARERFAAIRPDVLRDISATQDMTREDAVNVLGKDNGWSADQGRAYVTGGLAAVEAFKAPVEKVKVNAEA